MHVAEEAATLDVLTGGNYILGVGLGYREPEFDSFGIPLAERAPRFVEAIRLMRRLWTEDRVTFDGRFYSVKDAGIGLKPVRAGGPPIYIAAQVDAAIKRAARIGDAWLIVQCHRPRQGGAADAAVPGGAGGGGTHAGGVSDRARVLCRRQPRTRRSRNAARRWNTNTTPMRRGGWAHRTGQPFEEFARDRFIIGDKVSVKEEIARYRERLGVDHFIMRCQWPGLPQERVLGSIRRLGDIFGR